MQPLHTAPPVGHAGPTTTSRVAGLLGRVNALLGAFLLVVGAATWTQADHVPASIARMGVFAGIAALGLCQVASERGGSIRGIRLLACLWTIACGAAVLALRIA